MGVLKSRLAVGLTLIELVLTLVLISILAAVAVPRLPRATEVNVVSQGEAFAADLRRARMLAMSQLRSVCIAPTTGAFSLNGDVTGYRVSEFSSATTPNCSSAALDDPVAGSLSVTLPSGIVLRCVSGCTDFRFRSNGEPSASASFSLTGGARSVTVAVLSPTGEVTGP